MFAASGLKFEAPELHFRKAITRIIKVQGHGMASGMSRLASVKRMHEGFVALSLWTS